jgi:hypothetical protein
MTELLQDYTKLTEEELDAKIEDVMKKLDIAYSMGQGPIVDQLIFHLDNLKMELGDRLEKQRFDIITHKVPEQYNVTDDELTSSEESKDET